MTILAHDTFTGTDSDISGRTPDVVGGGATWEGPMSPTTGIIAVGSPGGAHSDATFNDAYYRLTGLTLPSVYTQTITPGALTDGWQSILVNMVPGGDGYEILLTPGPSGTVFLYKVTGYSFDLLDQVDAGATAVLSVERNETTGAIRVRADGALIMSVTDSDYLAGAPGISIANGGSTADSVLSDYVITDEEAGDGTSEPPTGDEAQNIALDHFTGAEDIDIDTRVPDGRTNPPAATECADLINGVWHKSAHGGDFPGGANIDVIADDEVLMAGVGLFTDSDGTSPQDVTRPADAVTGDGMLLVVAVKGTTRHAHEPAGWTLLDTITGSGEEMIVAFKAVGASEPYSYTITFTGSGSTPVAAHILMVKDGGTLGAVASQSTWLSATNLGPISGLTPGAAPSVVIAIGAKPAALNDNAVLTASGWRQAGWASATAFFTGFSSIGDLWRYQTDGTPVSAVTIVDSGTGAAAGAGVGLMVELILSGAPAIPGTGLAAVRYPGTTFGNYAIYVLKDLPEILSVAQKYMVEAEFIVQQTEWANLVFDLLVGADPDYDLGYIVMYGWGPSAGDFDSPPGTNGLVAVNRINYGSSSPPAEGGGTYTRLRTAIAPNTAIPGERVKLRVCFDTETIPGSAIITVYVNDVFLCTATDSGLQQPGVGGVPGDADARWPGMSGQDSSSGFQGRGFKIDYFRVAQTCDASYPTCGEFPCEGPPENPYPWFPPPETEYPTEVGVWVKKFGKYRFVTITVDDVLQDTVRPKGLGLYRQMAGPPTIKILGKYRTLAPAVIIHGENNPPGTVLPPFLDPCEELPPFPPPEDVEIGDPPARVFFAYENAATQTGADQLFNGTVRSLGNWTPMEIGQVTARNGYIILSQGNYAKFRIGGTGPYSFSLYSSYVDSHGSYMGIILTAQSAGRVFGMQAADDFEVPSLWPPNGLDNAELTQIFAKWKSTYPGIRIGLRARAMQFSGSNYPQFLDFIISQYRYWGLNNLTPAQYVAVETSLAAPRGWKILWSNNVLHGGGIIGGVRQPMSIPQLQNAMYTFSDNPVNNWGCGIWRRDAGYEAVPGVLQTYATARNKLSALGVP